jgi:hypothetical protein
VQTQNEILERTDERGIGLKKAQTNRNGLVKTKCSQTELNTIQFNKLTKKIIIILPR